jgi:hypothetical protein
VAFLYPGRRELGQAIRRLLERGHAISHGTDHGASVSVYLATPTATESSSTTTDPARSGSKRTVAQTRRAEPFDPNDLLPSAPRR